MALSFVSLDHICGLVAFSDSIKEDARKAIITLKKMGMKVVMLTGDNEKTAEAIGRQVRRKISFPRV